MDWEQWLVQHGPALLLFARQQCRCEADAQDLVQEAILESWRRQGGEASPPVALVFATIRRRAVDLARSTKRRAVREATVQAEAELTWFDSSPEEREWSQILQQAMGTLPEIYRQVVTLKTWGELTFAEIAVALEIPANTAASRYRYALDTLRQLLQAREPLEKLKTQPYR